MINHFAVIAAIFSFNSSASADSEIARTPLETYMFCVLESSVAFSGTTESAEVVVKAAETNCARLKDAAIDHSVADLRKGPPPPHPVTDAELRRLAEDYISTRLRDEAMLKVIQVRSRAN